MNLSIRQLWSAFKNRQRFSMHYLRHVGWRFVDDGCQNSAAALTYMTLFAAVPMITVMYSMFSMIPSFQGVGDQVRDLILSNFIPTAGAEVQEHLINFSAQARRLGVVGAAVLFITSYLMLANIEKTFNRIWAVPSKRMGVSSFLLYWAALSLGPLLIGAGLVMNTYILSLQVLEIQYFQIGEGLRLVFKYLPWILTAVAFTLLYKVVPNCRVPFRNALLGGVVATVLFEMAKSGFSNLVGYSSYTNIYGAFAILPLFLLWIYLCWIIILSGAEFVRALETYSVDAKSRRLSELMAGLIVLWHLWQAQREGEQVSDYTIIKSGLSATQWRSIRDDFLKRKWIAATESGRFILARDLTEVSVWDLVLSGTENFTYVPKIKELLGQRFPWFHGLNASLESIEQQAETNLSLSIDALFRHGVDLDEK